eukprot:SAG22_NODE_1179_length_5239_cov_1.898249_1_plen_116_part_00
MLSKYSPTPPGFFASSDAGVAADRPLISKFCASESAGPQPAPNAAPPEVGRRHHQVRQAGADRPHIKTDAVTPDAIADDAVTAERDKAQAERIGKVEKELAGQETSASDLIKPED